MSTEKHQKASVKVNGYYLNFTKCYSNLNRIGVIDMIWCGVILILEVRQQTTKFLADEQQTDKLQL